MDKEIGLALIDIKLIITVALQNRLNLILNKLTIVPLVLTPSYSPLPTIWAFPAPLLATLLILLAIPTAVSPVDSIAVPSATPITTYTDPTTPPSL